MIITSVNIIMVLDIVDTSWLVDDMAKNTIQYSMVIVTVHGGFTLLKRWVCHVFCFEFWGH